MATMTDSQFLHCLSCGVISAWAQCSDCYGDVSGVLNNIDIFVEVSAYSGKYDLFYDGIDELENEK